MTTIDPSTESVFFAYAGQPPLRAELMRETIKALKDMGMQAEGWEDLEIGGRILIDAIKERIDGCTTCVAEVSSNNPNVLFEAGYALAKGKKLLLALDDTDDEATRNWSGLAMVDTIGRLNYGGNAHKLARSVYKSITEGLSPLMETLLAEGKPREENAVFAPSTPHETTQSDRLQRLLERKTHLNLIVSQDEFGMGPLSFYAQSVYRSSAAILHFIKPTRLRASIYNAQLALIAGIVHGLDLPLLMVAEPEYQSPLDYKDLLFHYNSVAQMTEHVERWLKSLPTGSHDRKRLGRLKLDIELPIRTFGQYVAESESEELSDYFIPTNEFDAVLDGRAAVFVGRKGTGKTANMQQATTELRTDRRNLVVPIKPSSYDLSGLIETMARFEDTGGRDYFLINLWSYILVTEMALRCLSHAEDLPAGLGGDWNTSELADVVSKIGIDREADFTTRLDNAIATSQVASELQARQASENLKNQWHLQIMPKLRPILQSYDRVCVLIDNLDKTWERGVDFESLSHFLLSLLVTSGRLENEFSRSKNGLPAVRVTVTVFLRTDIYDVITKYAREPDKISPQSIQWSDEELLIRVLDDRYLRYRLKSKRKYSESLWSEVFCSEVHGLSTRDYLLWRALPRPRDLIYLGNAALTTAVNRGHDCVLAQDFTHAESLYSRFAVEALLVESEGQGFDLEEVIFELAGLDSTFEESELLHAIKKSNGNSGIIDWLIRTSFLGLENRSGGFVHVEGEIEAKKKKRVAERISERSGRALRYRVHPAFRPYLEIVDDDLF